MTESQWYEVSYFHFARLFRFEKKNDNHPRIHLALKLEARKINFIYPRSEKGNFGETTDMLPFDAYLNQLFRRTVTPREGNGTKIIAYNKNILAVMAPNANGFEFSIFDFIWKEIKAILKNPLKNYRYAPYLMHMIERLTARTFFCEKEHHPLWINNDLRAPMEDSRAAAPHYSTPRVARGRGQPRDKPPSPIQKKFNLLFGMCKSQHVADVKTHHERRERKKITKSMKEIHAHLNLQPPSSSIASGGEESPEIESFEERIARFDKETPVQQLYSDASFRFDYGGLAGASSSHPPPFDSPPLANPQHVEESKDEDNNNE
jgi:AraC-like DNA-binding protein